MERTGGRRVDPLASRLQRHAGRPRRHGAGDAGERRRGRQDRGHGAIALRDCLTLREIGQQHARADVADCDGRSRPRVARARQLDGIVLDLRRRRRRARPDRRASGCRTNIDSAASARARRSTASSASRSRTRCLRPCTTRRFAPRISTRSICRWPRPTSTTSSTFAEAAGLAGVSVTAPFKVDAFERADECDPVSRRIQSVNTLRRDGGRWLGCNTDVDRIPGAARVGDAAAAACARRSSAPAAPRDRCRWRWPRPACKVTIAARRIDQAQAVAALTGAATGDVAARSGVVGSARQRHAGRHGAARRRIAAAGRLSLSRRRHRLRPGLQPAAHAAARATPARAGCRTIGGLDMLVAQAQAQFEWWTGGRPADRVMREAALAGWLTTQAAQNAQRSNSEADDVRRVRGPGQAGHVRAGVQGAGGGPADAGVGVPEGRRALRLRVPARKRRGRRARRALLVPRQGSVPDPSRPRRPDGDREGRRHDQRREAVHRHAARADEQLPVAVRARAAALHRRRRRLSRLRHRGVVRADRPRATATRRSIATMPASCCSTRCWRSITCSTASC